MADDSKLNSSLESLEKRLDRLEFSVGRQRSNRTLSHNVDSLLRDLNELVRIHPEIDHVDQLLKKYGLSDIYTRDLPNEKTHELVRARIGNLDSVMDQLSRLETLTLLPIDQIACSPNPDGINSVVQAYERASIRSVELLSRWLYAIYYANTVAGNAEAVLKATSKP